MILPTSELGIQNTSVAYTEIESVNDNPLAFTRVALKSVASTAPMSLKTQRLLEQKIYLMLLLI